MLTLKKITSVSFIKLLGAVLSVLYYLLQVDYFGVSNTIECYFIAVSLTAFLLSLTQVGHLSGHYLPIYHSQEKEYGVSAANASFWVVVNWLLLICVGAIVISIFLSDILVALIAPGFEEPSKELAALLFRFLGASILLQLLNIKSTLLLNALNVFNRSEVFNLLRVFVATLVLYFGFQELGVWALVWGVYLGSLLTLILNLHLLYKNGVVYQFIFSTPHFDHRLFFKNLLFIYPFIFSKRFFDFVLTAVISFLPQGVYAIYKYVESIFLKTGGIILSPTVNIFFTNYSIESVNKSKKTVKLLDKAFRINLLVALYSIVIVFSFGSDIVGFFWFQKIDSSLEQLAYLFLLASFLSLIFVAIGGLCFKILFVLQKTRRLYTGRAIVNLILAIYAVLAIRFFQSIGLVSVILMSAILSNSLFFILAKREERIISNMFNKPFLIKTFSIFLLGLILGYEVNQFNFLSFSKGRFGILLLLIFKTTILSIGLAILFYCFKPKIEKASFA